MKHVLFVLLYLCCLVVTSGQSNYIEAINQGDEAFRTGQYKMAINKFFAAEAFDPSKKEIIKEKINKVFEKIESLRKEADVARSQATLSAKEAQASLAKAQKLIDAFYFYEDKFALTLGGTIYDYKFFFIDKNGDKVERLSEWDKAEPFEGLTGFAKVSQQNTGPYLLDTMGNTFPAAYDLAEMNENIQALNLSAIILDEFPDEVLKYTQLKILILQEFFIFGKSKIIRTVPAEISNLKNLEYLDLQSCKIISLPEQIGELKNLWGLNLDNNELNSVPVQIGELKKLTTLYLGQNDLDNIPEQIFGLNDLRILVLEKNKLKNLPVEIGNLKKLTWLFLGENQLSTLPVEISELRDLKKLSLHSNDLTSLPSQIGGLTLLTYLDLSGNKLTKLPVQIGKLRNLKTLDLSSNPIPKSEQEKIKKLLPDCQIEF